MERYVCRFCIALHVPQLSRPRAQVEAHVRDIHRYPMRSALSILGAKRAAGRQAAELIELAGPVMLVAVPEPVL